MSRAAHRGSAALVGAALAVVLAAAGCAPGSSGGAALAPVAPGPQGVQAPAPDSGPSRNLGSTPHRDTAAPSGTAAPGLAMTDAARDPLSTFALDVDTGGYTRFRDAVSQGYRVYPDEVRTEEFVNYFEQDYAPPRDGLDVNIDATALPFRPGHRLVRVGVRSADVSDAARPDADLSLVVDCSGSMGDYGKMETTRAALRALVTSLRPTDRVAMVCYSTDARVALEPTAVAERGTVLDAIDALAPRASTDAAAGLALGYDLAASMRTEGRMSRVVLVSDGVDDVGETTPGGILERISTEAGAGTILLSVGIGIRTREDRLLEQLADRGDGWHVYVDTQAEAEQVFGTGLTGSLVVTARDARARVEFDPAQVAAYRLLGYESRSAPADDVGSLVGGGVVFAGHAATALYDIELRDGSSPGTFVTATVHYRDGSGRPVDRTRRLAGAECATAPAGASPRLRQDLVIAMLTDRLVGGPWSPWVTAADLRAEAGGLPGVLEADPDVAELVALIDRVTP